MNRSFFLLLTVLLVAAFPQALIAQERPADKPTVSAADKEFMVKAAEGGLFEVKAGEMATQAATDPRVKAFAQRMVDEHSQANNELQALAQKKGVELPQQMNEKQQKEFDELSNAAKPDFDKKYMDIMVKDHEKDVADFEKQSMDAADPDLKAWVTKTTPTLRAHLAEARDVNNQIKGAPVE